MLLKLNQSNLAINELRQAAHLDPYLVEARSALAQALQKTGDKDEARRELESVQRINRERDAVSRALILIETAAADMKKGNTGKAIGELREAAALSPELLEAHYQLGLALGRSAEAESAFRRVLQLNPNHAPAHYQLGLAFAARGDHTAASEFKLAVELAPGLTEAHRALAKLATTAKDWTTAEAHWTSVLAWIPDDPAAHANLTVVLKARNRPQ